MYHFHGLAYLTPRTWLQVKGLPANDGSFLALEISLAADEDIKLIRVQGIIQQIDLDEQTVVISNKKIRLPGGDIHTLRNTYVTLAELQPGNVLRLDGRYAADGQFVAEKAYLLRHYEFNLDKLFGRVETVQPDEKKFTLFGLPITMTADTSIELT